MTIRAERDIYERTRQLMIDTQLIPRGITQSEVLHAMATVPRHLFVEEGLYAQAYNDYPLPIGEKQTISQPYMVALMTESLALTGTEKVLEIGTGSGYQSAVLSMVADKVYSMERIPTIAARARKLLAALHCSNVIVRVGDGTFGWPEDAPFDAIIAAASSPQVPEAYIAQLKEGGRLVMPVGAEDSQKLLKITKRQGKAVVETLGECRFVKLIGRYGWQMEKRETGC
ncbi:MAG: protein-L-isoaspartate(D-aspartate) O-methyltransferase [Deltaproteobacteria bacterium]|nr:protein-L-isoaspartate(D-aspartate) O-methyltransferase [Deltaproteobacteria bacterium]